MVLTCKREKDKSEAILCFWKPLKAQENQYVNLKPPGSLFCKTKKKCIFKALHSRAQMLYQHYEGMGMRIRRPRPALDMEYIQGQPGLKRMCLRKKCTYFLALF